MEPDPRAIHGWTTIDPCPPRESMAAFEAWSRLRDSMDRSPEVELAWRDRIHPLYAISVLGFVVVLSLIASREGQFQPVHRATMVLAVLGLVYGFVVQVVNRTRIQLLAETLRIAHGPLPWRGSVEVPVDQVRSLRCDPHSRRLILRTALGEDIVLAENLPAATLGAIDARIRECLGVGRAT